MDKLRRGMVVNIKNPNKHLLMHKNNITETICDAMSSSLCWNCCHRSEDGLSTYANILGAFCSPNCALRHCIDNGYSSEDTSLLHLEYMRQNSGEILIMAPPRYVLSIFGGTLSIDEYRVDFSKTKGCGRSEYVVMKSPYPCVYPYP
jgi:hypothetical protein